MDSSYGGDSDDGSALNYGSVTSSIYNYRKENGRTYHAVCFFATNREGLDIDHMCSFVVL